MNSKTFIFLLFSLIFLLTCKDRPRTNPFDPKTDLHPYEWAPSNLQVEVLNDSQIRIIWQQEEKRIDGFRIARSANNVSFLQIAELGPNINEYTDTGLILGVNYTYRVKAFTETNESNYAFVSINFWRDCHDDWGGSAFNNECGCVGGLTGLETDYCYGCTDSNFNNYDPEATIDDGSCSNLPVDLEMVTLQGGTFQMGEIWGVGYGDELPVHTVTLSSFSISSTEITNQQYADYLTEALAGGDITATVSSVTGPWNGGGSYEYLDLNAGDCQISYSGGQFFVDTDKENHPVIEVSWYGAAAFAEHYGYRLPTEAEWEYAARGISAGVDTKWSGTSTESDLPDYAWYSVNNNPYGTKEVGTKLPNGNGLYDMSGNVWEWCHDWYSNNYYNSSPEVNPQGPGSGSYRVIRGGDSYNNAYSLRCSSRGYGLPSNASNVIGFRISRTQ